MNAESCKYFHKRGMYFFSFLFLWCNKNTRGHSVQSMTGTLTKTIIIYSPQITMHMENRKVFNWRSSDDLIDVVAAVADEGGDDVGRDAAVVDVGNHLHLKPPSQCLNLPRHSSWWHRYCCCCCLQIYSCCRTRVRLLLAGRACASSVGSGTKLSPESLSSWGSVPTACALLRRRSGSSQRHALAWAAG